MREKAAASTARCRLSFDWLPFILRNASASIAYLLLLAWHLAFGRGPVFSSFPSTVKNRFDTRVCAEIRNHCLPAGYISIQFFFLHFYKRAFVFFVIRTFHQHELVRLEMVAVAHIILNNRVERFRINWTNNARSPAYWSIRGEKRNKIRW